MRQKKPNSETAILAPLVEFLEILSNQGRLRYFRAHPVRLASKNGKTFPVKVRPSQRGAPDLFVFLPEEVIWVEGKSKNGRLSHEQIQWGDFTVNRPYRYFAPRSHADVNAVIKWIRDRV